MLNVALVRSAWQPVGFWRCVVLCCLVFGGSGAGGRRGSCGGTAFVWWPFRVLLAGHDGRAWFPLRTLTPGLMTGRWSAPAAVFPARALVLLRLAPWAAVSGGCGGQ